MAALKLYYFGPNMLQTPKNEISEDREVDNRLEKNTFC